MPFKEIILFDSALQLQLRSRANALVDIERDERLRVTGGRDVKDITRGYSLIRLLARRDEMRRGRPAYHPLVLLKLDSYGSLNRVRSSRRLVREAGRNIEVIWLLAGLALDHKTIADFRKDNSLGLRKVCAYFVELCRGMGLLTTASVAIDRREFKVANNRDKKFKSAIA